jgi:Uma2 family endonuclease
MSVIQTKRITPADLLTMPEGKNYELVDGELVERNVSVLSSLVEGNVVGKLQPFCDAHQLGSVLTASNGLRCFSDDPDKVRKPDISFVKRERLTHKHLREGFLTIAPDLAVEVISPNDLASELNEKVVEYRSAGISLIWIIDPEVRTGLVFRIDGTVTQLGMNDELSGENVIPGFCCQVAELFPEVVVADNREGGENGHG